MFQRFLKRICARYEAADGKSFDFGATKVVMSRPVPHGEENGEMGWVLMTTVRTSDQVFLHSSDVQGPMSNDTTQLILDQKPVLLVLGGPPFYLKNVRVAESSITRAILNAAKITAAVPITIFDHHALRTESWQMDAKLLYEAAVQSGNRVSTAAEFAGQKNTMLEARREELYKVEPPSASFAKWSELPQEKRRVIVPPV